MRKHKHFFLVAFGCAALVMAPVVIVLWPASSDVVATTDSNRRMEQLERRIDALAASIEQLADQRRIASEQTPPASKTTVSKTTSEQATSEQATPTKTTSANPLAVMGAVLPPVDTNSGSASLESNPVKAQDEPAIRKTRSSESLDLSEVDPPNSEPESVVRSSSTRESGGSSRKSRDVENRSPVASARRPTKPAPKRDDMSACLRVIMVSLS